MRFGSTIFLYLIRAVMPYFVSSWLLLSVVLFVQQASRFSDIFFSANIPSNLIWQLSFALIPNVIAFTCPMAALVGVIIGLTKMQADSELVAIKAAGVGNFGIILPIIALGVFLSAFAFTVNLKGVPLAAGIVRQVALRTALYKLESPIEPGVFNTEVAGFTIYVKEGDIEQGTWKNIFIYNEDEKTKTVRLITSSSGRIDYSNENSELVLKDAISSTFTRADGAEKFFSERIGEVRYAVKTKRSEIIERLNSGELTPEELGLTQLSSYAQSKDGRERTEAELLWQRRIMLSITPLIFCLFGAVLVLRYNRKSRGFAIFSALLSLIVYYLLAFLGEQLARTGKLSVLAASLFPIISSGAVILWLLLAGRFRPAARLGDFVRSRLRGWKPNFRRVGNANLFVDLTTGLRDFDIISNLIKFYFLSLAFLGTVFLIFTAFELWKFAGTIDNGIGLLLKYLLFLTPFIYLQLAPSSAMIATLATYVIKSRQNEIVTWTSAGQSVYRLLLPCMLFMVILGFVNWQIQERIFPGTNQIQDELRSRIRSRGLVANRSGKLWVANDQRIFSFELDSNASDNANQPAPDCPAVCAVKNLTVYEFAADKTRLQSVYRISQAGWESNRIVFRGEGDKLDLSEGRIVRSDVTGGELPEASNPFGEARTKPSHLNAEETKAQIANSESDVEKRSFSVALEKKYTTAFLPFIIALFTAPFALSLSRKGKAATTGYAVGLWLLFMGITSVFEQLGINGALPASVAVWGPLGLFSMLGTYLLSRIRT
jgi:lipopolysaccharide export LptBFGC system permease protein LptF